MDLSKLCLTSKNLLELIEDYRQTKNGMKKFLVDVDVHTLAKTDNWPSDIIHSYFKLGIYMKRSSFLKSTSRRLKHISSYLHSNLICKENCGDGRRCISFYCYGTFLHTVIAGWDDIECLRVFDFVHQNAPVFKYIGKIFMCSPGVLPHLEIYVRCFYRRAFIDVLRKKEDKAFWLNQILKPYPMINQARLLQILFLAKTNVGVNFISTVRDRLDVAALTDLGNALVLLSENALWSDDSVISIIDEIITLPSSWHPQNVAALLLSCGEAILIKVLISKAINNRLAEIVCIAHNLLVVSVKVFQSIKKASQCIWSFIHQLKPTEKVHIATELVASFKDAIYDLIDVGGEPVRELEAVIEAMSQFVQDILDLALQPLTQNKQQPFTQISKPDIMADNPNASINEE